MHPNTSPEKRFGVLGAVLRKACFNIKEKKLEELGLARVKSHCCLVKECRRQFGFVLCQTKAAEALRSACGICIGRP